jgi:hypothetical protein
MKHAVPHDLGQDQAKKVAEAAFNSYKQRFAEYNPTVTWANDRRANISFKVKGVRLDGGVDIQDKSFDLDLNVPFLLRPFKGKALGVIEEEIRKWISKARAGEL